MSHTEPHHTQRLKLTLAYKGTRFKGWQIQSRNMQGREVRTVQGCLELTFERILGHAVRVHGAGRTDSGVHAMAQVAHVDIPADKMHVDWQRALNGLLPGDACVVAADPVDNEFHARFSSTGKTYAYALWLSRRYVLPQRSHYVWTTGPLNVAAMEQAAALLVGRHDYAAFQNVGTDVSSTVRCIHSIQRSADRDSPHPEEVWTFTADGFLKQMVRNLMGCLVAVGRERLAPAQVSVLLQGRDRNQCPPTAPACGLTLKSVYY